MLDFQFCGCGLSALGKILPEAPPLSKSFQLKESWMFLYVLSKANFALPVLSTIAISHFSIALHQLCCASRRACSCLSMVVPCFNRTTNSFHDAKFLWCSGLFSSLVKAALAFFQSFCPPLVKCICFAEKRLQLKQKRQLFYVTQLLLILSPLTKVLLKY